MMLTIKLYFLKYCFQRINMSSQWYQNQKITPMLNLATQNILSLLFFVSGNILQERNSSRIWNRIIICILSTKQMLNQSVFNEQAGKGNSKYPKYSLRHRHHKAHLNKFDKYRPFDNQLTIIQISALNQISHSSIQKQHREKDQKILSTTNSDFSSFSCIKNDGVIEFNKKNSVSVLHNQEGGFKISNPHYIVEQAQFLFYKKQNTKLQLITSDSFSNDSCRQSQKYSIKSHSKINNSTTLLKNPQSQKHIFKKDHQSKFSLKKSNSLTSGRSEYQICLRYADIKTPLRILNLEEKIEMQEMRQLIDQKQSSSKINKIVCNDLQENLAQGCLCEPKCLWFNRWVARISKEPFPIRKQEIINPQKWKATLVQIQKDLPRTQVSTKTFQSQLYTQHLREVLITYAKMDWSVGYVQGMNIIASVLVYHSTSAYNSLRVLSCLMAEKGLRNVFLADLSFGKNIARALSSQLKRLSYDLHAHLINQQIDIQMFVTSWYFSLLGSFVPLEAMHLVIDKYMRRGWSGINQVIMALFLLLRQELMIREEQELMQYLSNRFLEKRSILIDWNELILSSENLLLPKIKL